MLDISDEERERLWTFLDATEKASEAVWAQVHRIRRLRLLDADEEHSVVGLLKDTCYFSAFLCDQLVEQYLGHPIAIEEVLAKAELVMMRAFALEEQLRKD